MAYRDSAHFPTNRFIREGKSHDALAPCCAHPPDFSGNG